MYLNNDIISIIDIDFNRRLHKETVIDGKKKLAITRVLKRGNSGEEDKIYLTQVKSVGTENDKVTVKFYDGYKVYYKEENGTAKIVIQELGPEINKQIEEFKKLEEEFEEQNTESKNEKIVQIKQKIFDTLFDTKMPTDCPTITIEKDGKISRSENFSDQQSSLVQYFLKILSKEVELSNGVDFGITPMIFKLYTILHNPSLEQFPKIEKFSNENIFARIEEAKDTLKLRGNITDDTILKEYDLALTDDKTKSNFAIIPIIANTHISTMLIDLRKDFQVNPRDRLNFFDTSGGHIRLQNEELGKLRLNKQTLQLTGCCGYWNIYFFEECSKIQDIEKIKEQFQTGEMQLRLACKVSETIDVDFKNDKLFQEVDAREYQNSDKAKFIKIKIKNTDQYFLLDRENIDKSVCIDLRGINALLTDNECIEILQEDLSALEKSSKQQRKNIINKISQLCKPIISEAESIINQIDKSLGNNSESPQISAGKDILLSSVDVQQKKEITKATDLPSIQQSQQIKSQQSINNFSEILSLKQKIIKANYLKLKFCMNNLHTKSLLISMYKKGIGKQTIIDNEQTATSTVRDHAGSNQTIVNTLQTVTDNKQTTNNSEQINIDEVSIKKIIDMKTNINIHIEQMAKKLSQDDLVQLEGLYVRHMRSDIFEELCRLQLEQELGQFLNPLISVNQNMLIRPQQEQIEQQQKLTQLQPKPIRQQLERVRQQRPKSESYLERLLERRNQVAVDNNVKTI